MSKSYYKKNEKEKYLQTICKQRVNILNIYRLSLINFPSSVCIVLVTQSCLTLCDPMDYSSPGSSVHGILQVRILEWVVISFSRGSS